MRFSQLAFVVLANLLGATAICHQSLHHSAAEINLVKGAERGTATLPLHTATLDDAEDDKPSRTIYFALIDASDEEFCKEYECVPSPKLIGAPDDSMELDATFVAGAWTFHHDPGTVTTSDTSRAISNPSYSPLKKISWEGQTVVVNVPFVKWGDAPNQQMLIDGDGCINEIRRNRPNPFFVGGGPPIGPGYDCPNERPQDRYKGGQLLALNVDAMTFTIKLHNSFHVFPYELPHYVVFENSKLAAAEGTGVIHAPRLTNLGDSVAEAPLFQFANGVPVRGGGPGRFQPGLTSYKGGVCNYVPMWLINWFFFDCDGICRSFVERNGRTLQRLSFGNPHISSFEEICDDRILQLIGSSCPNLESLTLHCCYLPHELAQLRLPKLKQLILHQITAPNDPTKPTNATKPTTNQHFRELMPILQSFTPEHFRQFADGVPKLESLCMNIMNAGVLEQMATIKDLRLLQLQNFKGEQNKQRVDHMINLVARKDIFPVLAMVVVGLLPEREHVVRLFENKPTCRMALQ